MANSILYVIQQGYDTFFKIGRTDNSAEARCKELQTGNPNKLRVFGIIEVSGDLANEENILHKELSKYRVEGEWFCVNPVKIIAMINSRNGKVIVDDPLAISFIKGNERIVTTDRGIDPRQDRMNLAKAIVVRRKTRWAYLFEYLISIPASLIADFVLCGFIYLLYSAGNDMKLAENSNIFWVWFKAILVPMYVIIVYMNANPSEIFIPKISEHDVLLEYEKLNHKDAKK